MVDAISCNGLSFQRYTVAPFGATAGRCVAFVWPGHAPDDAAREVHDVLASGVVVCSPSHARIISTWSLDRFYRRTPWWRRACSVGDVVRWYTRTIPSFETDKVLREVSEYISLATKVDELGYNLRHLVAFMTATACGDVVIADVTGADPMGEQSYWKAMANYLARGNRIVIETSNVTDLLGREKAGLRCDIVEVCIRSR